MKVLITGGTGFIGSRVVDLLVEHGHSVRLFSRHQELPPRLAGKDVSLFPGDLKDPQTVLNAMAGADAFYHLGELKNTSRHAAEANVRLVELIIKQLRRSEVKRLVFVSSITVAGIPSSIPAAEETAPRLLLDDQYTRYKMQCEEALADKLSREEYAVVRPGVVYGSGSRSLGGLISAVKRIGPLGLPFAGKGRNIAPLIHVQDLADAVYLAGIEKNAAGQVFNLTDGFHNSWFDFFNTIAVSLGTTFRMIPLPVLALRVPALFFDGISGLLNIRIALNSFLQYVSADLLFDNAKAKRLLRWEPRFDLKRGVEEMIQGWSRP
jgi:nucleoside-diphosphate-sugar epimerase